MRGKNTIRVNAPPIAHGFFFQYQPQVELRHTSYRTCSHYHRLNNGTECQCYYKDNIQRRNFWQSNRNTDPSGYFRVSAQNIWNVSEHPGNPTCQVNARKTWLSYYAMPHWGVQKSGSQDSADDRSTLIYYSPS